MSYTYSNGWDKSELIIDDIQFNLDMQKRKRKEFRANFTMNKVIFLQRSLNFDIEEDFAETRKLETFKLVSPHINFSWDNKIIRGRPPDRPSFKNLIYELPQYPFIYDPLIESKFKAFFDGTGYFSEKLNSINFIEYFKELLLLEERQMIVDIENYTKAININELIRIPISNSRSDCFYKIECPGVADDRPNVNYGDKIFVVHANQTYSGYVWKVESAAVLVKFTDNFKTLIQNSEEKTAILKFKFSRTSLRYAHRGLDLLGFCGTENFRNWCFPVNTTNFDANNSEFTNIALHSKKLNAEQKKAVTRIVFNLHGSTPHIIFGPPGTGKTLTLVESIKIMHLFNKHCRILVLAPSVNAADLLLERLTSHALDKKPSFTKENIIRIHSHTRLKKDIPKDILKYSYNINDKLYCEIPPLKELKRFNVIVCTLFCAAFLRSTGLFDVEQISGQFSRPFTHVFFDEAGQASEAEVWAAISGFFSPFFTKKESLSEDKKAEFDKICKEVPKTDKEKIKLLPNLIIAGDPNQLGPEAHFNTGDQGLARSYLARIVTTCEAYKEKKATDHSEAYENPQNITKLLRNYRSDLKILDLFNKKFYNAVLKSEKTSFLNFSKLGWLPSTSDNYPVIFHNVDGIDQQQTNSPSWFNTAEIQIVINYVKCLLFGSECPVPVNEQSRNKTKIRSVLKKRKEYETSIFKQGMAAIKSSQEEVVRSLDSSQIGIIAPYRNQLERIRTVLNASGLGDIKSGLISDFQGDEREVIILSCVRATSYVGLDYNNGFLRDSKKFNVAISRAKSLLVVVGKIDRLIEDENWKYLFDECLKNDAVVNYHKVGNKANKKRKVEFKEDLYTDLDYLSKSALMSQQREVKFKSDE
ncbi:hypothetical protein HK099_004299 [Clydaea vesicula]|uniref:RNA helicase n=1 Tax=Clydaea vesicula TaxID=447962 RepID=A0AAD5UC23_9FUNG|nr:hypothetical protein HK099_004299 [Clydaea vesicula]